MLRAFFRIHEGRREKNSRWSYQWKFNIKEYIGYKPSGRCKISTQPFNIQLYILQLQRFLLLRHRLRPLLKHLRFLSLRFLI